MEALYINRLADLGLVTGYSDFSELHLPPLQGSGELPHRVIVAPKLHTLFGGGL